jgi:hypothetical protein
MSRNYCRIYCSWFAGKCRLVVAGIVVVVGMIAVAGIVAVAVAVAVAGKKMGHNLVTSKTAAIAVLVAAKRTE